VRAFFFAAMLVIGCGGSSAPVVSIADAAYLNDGLAKHRLDMCLPRNHREAPLVVFIHGGAFMAGDRRDYASAGSALAEEDVAVAVPSYRLYPEADARGAASDVAAAIAWLLRHGSVYGLDTSVILAGHSAGGRIAALLATHEPYLTSLRARFHAVRGAFVLAGAYDVRDLSDEPADWKRIEGRIFGETAAERALACGTRDDPGACPPAHFFARRLTKAGIDCSALEVQAPITWHSCAASSRRATI